MKSLDQIRRDEAALAEVERFVDRGEQGEMVHVCSFGWIFRSEDGNYAVKVCPHLLVYGRRGALLYNGGARGPRS